MYWKAEAFDGLTSSSCRVGGEQDKGQEEQWVEGTNE
jgi:hypothetical protein